jgi:hypothetical protein
MTERVEVIAQAYFDGQPIVRVFDRHGVMIADLPMRHPPSDHTADNALKALGLQRREKWKCTSWKGREAAIRFRLK